MCRRANYAVRLSSSADDLRLLAQVGAGVAGDAVVVHRCGSDQVQHNVGGREDGDTLCRTTLHAQSTAAQQWADVVVAGTQVHALLKALRNLGGLHEAGCCSLPSMRGLQGDDCPSDKVVDDTC